MHIGEPVQLRPWRRPQQSFQCQLLSMLGKIIQRQDRGNLLLENIIQSKPNASVKSEDNFFQQQLPSPIHGENHFKQSQQPQRRQKEELFTAFKGQQPRRQRIVAVPSSRAQYESTLDAKIQASKKKLNGNIQQLLSGLNRVLANLQSDRQINPSDGTYKIDISRIPSQTVQQLKKIQSQTHIHETVKKHEKKRLELEIPDTNKMLLPIIPPRMDSNNWKSESDFPEQSAAIKSRTDISSDPFPQRQDMKLPSPKSSDKNTLENQRAPPNIFPVPSPNKSTRPRRRSMKSPTISFHGDNIKIQNSRIQINMGDETSLYEGEYASEHDSDILKKFLDSHFMALRHQDSIINDEREKPITLNRNFSLDSRIGTEPVNQISEGRETESKESGTSSEQKNSRRHIPVAVKKRSYQPAYQMESLGSFLKKPIIKVISEEGYHHQSKSQASSDAAEEQMRQKQQQEFGRIDFPSHVDIRKTKFKAPLLAKRKNTVGTTDFRNQVSGVSEADNTPDFDMSTIVFGKKNSFENEANQNIRATEDLFKSVKKLTIPWQLIGKQMVMLKKGGIDPISGDYVGPSMRLENNFYNLKMYSRLNEVQSYADKREMKIKVSFYQMFTSAHITEINSRIQFQTYISEWLGITYRATASIGWNMLYNHKLDYEQIKAFFTENIIFNYIQLMKDIKELGLKDFSHLVPEIINKKTVDIITFLCKQYPQTRAEVPNMALRNQIPHIDEKGKIEYDLVKNSGVQFKIKKGGDYSSQIMMFINYLIDVSNQHYGKFEEQMNRFFNKIFLHQNMRNQQPNAPTASTTTYAEKVKKYTKFVIGRKIPKNAPKYTQEQIDNGIFFIKSSAILRVLAKWVEDLIEIVQKPDAMIRDWFHPFKNHQGNEQFAEYPLRKGLYNVIINGREDLYQRIQNIRRECFRIEGQLSDHVHITDLEHAHLSEQQLNVGLFSSNLRNALSSYLCQQLNQVIHFLLAAPLRVDEKGIQVAQYFEDKTRNELDNLNLITFRIFDLIRCKCVSGQSEVLWMMDEMQKLDKIEKGNNDDGRIQIVRFKDRLGQGTRDILINLKVGDSPVCEIQLAVTNQVEEKQDMLDKYNHFLYELRRATMLGPLIENVSIWTTLQQKSGYFDEIVLKKFHKTKQIPYVHRCQRMRIKKFTQPMICVSCSVFFHIPRSCLSNWICHGCKTPICGQCLYSGMSAEERKKQLFGRFFNKEILGMLKQFGHKGQKVPKKSFFLKKNQLKPQLCFMTSYTVQQTIDQEKIFKAVQTVIKGGKIINRGLISSQEEMIKLNDFIIYEFDAHGRKQYLSLSQIESLDQQNENKLKFINLLQQPNYLESIREVSNTRKKAKLLQELSKAIDGKKIEVVKVKRTLVLIQVAMNYEDLQAEIVRNQNLDRIRQFSQSNGAVISIERKNVTDEMDLIRQQLGKQHYNNLQKNITKIYLNYGFMKSIESLSFLTCLESLSISDNLITSLKGVEKLHKLKTINFDRNKISSLEPLRNLVKLQYIMGNQNRLSTMKEVQKLRKLKQISFHANHISKLQGLDKLSELQILFIKNNEIETLSNFQYVKRLQQLTLSGNRIHHFESLTFLTNLKVLSLSELKLENIPPQVTQLTLLIELDLSNNLITVIPDMSRLSHLKKLKLKNNLISKIAGLENLKLSHLNLDGNKITTLIGIGNFFDTIEELNIRKNPVEDIGDLKDAQIEFKIYWTKSDFKPKARFDLETAFKQISSPLTLMANMLKMTNLRSSMDLGESMEMSAVNYL